MSQVRPIVFSRSQTRQQLPNIQTKIQRSGTLKHQKSYLGQVTKQISGNAQYDEANHINLNKQQRKLKDILKKMNDDTVRIISNYTPKVKKLHHHHRIATTILAINQKQVENNQKIISQCQHQIEKLKERAEGLNISNKSSFIQNIANISAQISSIQEQNRVLIVQNQKRGKEILSGYKVIQQGLIRKIQNDVYLAEHKASHLRADDQRVKQQIKLYEGKLKQINQKWIQAQKYLKQQQKKQIQKKQHKNLESQFLNCKAVLQNVKKKNQFYNQNFQFRYYNLLKQVDITNLGVNQTQQRLQKATVQLSASQMIISKLQAQLNSLKQKKKKRQQSINEFLQNTRPTSIKNSSSKSEQKLLHQSAKQMPSDIQIKEDVQLNSSEVDLGQAIKGQSSKNVQILRQISKEMKKQSRQRQDVNLSQRK